MSAEPAGRMLGDWAAALDWNKVPADIATKVLDHVVDSVGVMYSGLDVPECRAARETAAQWGAGDEATVVGAKAPMPAPSAAFVNGLNGRIHTYDDTYEPGTVHPGSPVIATSLALGEKHAIGGAEFLCAVLAGYEVATRVAAAVSPAHYEFGFHNTGTCNAFGTAVSGARVLKLDGLAIAETMGLASATAAGLRQHQIDGSMLDSAFHGARAAQSGVMVAQLRASGVKGPPAILEGPMGFCHIMSPQRDLSKLTADLGSRFEFEKMTIKPYPTCRFVHGPIEAAIETKRRCGIDPAKIASVTISAYRQSMSVSDRPEIRTPFDAIVSHQYAVARALLHENVDLADMSGAALEDPVVLALMRKVKVVHDEELEKIFPKCWPHRLTIAMDDGTVHTGFSEFPPGRVTPIPSARVDEKFLKQATPFLGEERAVKALAALRGIAGTGDVREAGRLLRPL
jgi:2-methylcitrate dehydratase PrpD